MAVLNEGNGVSYTFTGFALDPITMQVAGYNREPIDLTTLSNSAVKTYVTSALADYQPFTLVSEFDATQVDSMPSGGEGGAFVITFPNSGGSLTFYASLLSVGNTEIANATRPTFELTFQPTNRNAGVETVPAYSA